MLSAFALVFLIIPDDFAAVNSLPFINLLHIYLIDSIYAFLLACYSLYFIRRFHQIQIGQQCNATKLDKRKIENILLNSEKYNEVKFVKIYEQIVAYFETKQPYLNINFKIGKMAHDLNINTVYLAKAIRLKQNMNFNNFVNFYRIEKAKELIRNTASKYTLEYIYLSSGFKSQSSFNAAFKFKEGITPSVYVQRVKNTD
jgi:AraC-like DNA-binding protein